MNVLLKIKDGKVEFVMELLNNLSFVEAKQLSDEKAEIISNVREAVEEFNLIREGKLEAIPAEDLFE